MKKFTDYIKPNLLIIFGALLLLFYLNYLSSSGTALARGIFAVVISAYYLTVGILLVLIGDKFSPMCKKVLGILSVSLFALFMFVNFLLTTIRNADGMGPTAWIINILSMVAALALIIVYIISKFSDKPIVFRCAYLFSLIFVLALLLDILFDNDGDAIVLGLVNILLVVIYALYSFYLFGSLEKIEEVPAKAEKKEEPAPAEPDKKEESVAE